MNASQLQNQQARCKNSSTLVGNVPLTGPVPAHLQRLAAHREPINVDTPQATVGSVGATMRAQKAFNARDAAENRSAKEANASCVPLEQARNLYRHQNSMFRPESRVGNTMKGNVGDAMHRTLSVADADGHAEANMPFSDIMCALEKEERVRAQVDQRIAEAKAAGHSGNRTLERARALRTGTIVPRKNIPAGGGGGNGALSHSLLGNTVHGMSGGASSSASYDVSSNESNSFLERMTGVEFEGKKCQRLARKERGILAPAPMPEPPTGFLPGGGRFLSDRERMDLEWDNPGLSGQFVKPHKTINPHQWTDRPVSYRPPTRYTLADEIPTQDTTNVGVFMQPEPIGERIHSEETLAYRNMPGENAAAVAAQQIRAPKDESHLAKFRKNIGPEQPRFPFASDIDVPIAHSERLATYEIVKPRIERDHLAQGSTDSIARGISLLDDDVMYDPSITDRIGVQANEREAAARTQRAEIDSMAAAQRGFESGRITGDNEAGAGASAAMQHSVSGARAADIGRQREAAAAAEHRDRSDLHSRVAISGDEHMLQSNPNVAALERGGLRAPRSVESVEREREREARAFAGHVGVAVDDERLTGASDRGLAGAVIGATTESALVRKRTTAREKLSMLRARMAAKRGDLLDEERFVDVGNAKARIGGGSVQRAKRTALEQERVQKNLTKVRDALQRARFTAADADGGDPDLDVSGTADRIAESLRTRAHLTHLDERIRQREVESMQNAGKHMRPHMDPAAEGFVQADPFNSKIATSEHRTDGKHGERCARREAETIRAARVAASRASYIDAETGEQYEGTADRAAAAMSIGVDDMADSSAAQRHRRAEKQTASEGRERLQRQSAYEGLDADTVGTLAARTLGTYDYKQNVAERRERNMAAHRVGFELDGDLVGDSADTRVAQQRMSAPESVEVQQRTASREQASMRAAADAMAAVNYGTGLDYEGHSMRTQSDIREMDTGRAAFAERRVMSDGGATHYDALHESHEASGVQEAMISGGLGGEVGLRARQRGEAHEREMLARDVARRQVLRPTDMGAWEHHTIDSAIGTEPAGGQAAWDRRMERREEVATERPRVVMDAMSDVMQTEHILQQLEPVRCASPLAVLREQRQRSHDRHVQRIEAGPPAHLLPRHMLPGGRKTVVPRGSPIPQ